MSDAGISTAYPSDRPCRPTRRRRIAALTAAVVLPVSLVTAVAPPAGAAATTALVNPTATVAVDISADRRAIDPRIYGLNFATPAQLADLRVPLNRSGGNTNSTYNWRINADNKGNDWYFQSIGYASAVPGQLHDSFITGTAGAAAAPMVTIPMMGRVAKLGPNRSKLASFSVAKYGPQQATDSQWMPDAGNGVRLNGSLIQGDPNDASTPTTVADQKAWISHLVATHGAASATKPRYYLYDNEPGLWHETHRDMVPTGPTMQQLLDRTVAYGTMVRATDPGATLVGPEGWGWLDLKYSGADQQVARTNGWSAFPDRAAHGNTDQFPWLLAQLAAREKATGTRLLDVATVHWYPQGGEFGNDGGTAMAQLRNRSTRQLWDVNYTEEAWIREKTAAIPRLQQWVRENYPGTKVGITEYSWGGETTMSGAVAQADVLGIFGRTGLDLANRWTTPPTGSPVYQAIKLYRNYDGLGSGFGDTSVRATVANPDNVAAFAATRADGATTVMVLNKYVTGSTPISVSVAGRNASGTEAAQVWQLTGGTTTRLADATVTDNKTTLTLPAQSVTLLVLPKPKPVPPPTPVITSSATSMAGTTGAANPLKASIKVASAPITGAIVDLEVFDSAGRRVFQRYYTGQTFTAGQTRTYSTSWIPAAAGTYTVKVGVFTTAWAGQLHWNNAAATVAVTGPDIPVLTSTAAVTPASPKVGAATSTVVTVRNTGGAALTGGIVDLEIYRNGTRVAQQWRSNVSVPAGGSTTSTFTWTPPATGTYVVKVGVFTAGWATNPSWNDAAATFKVVL